MKHILILAKKYRYFKGKRLSNLIISQTLSKAWGRGAIRIGIAYASSEIISYYNKVKPPYNVSKINQIEAVKTLDNIDVFSKTNKLF